MRMLCKLSLVLGLSVALVGPAFGQFGGGFGGRGGTTDPLSLLRRDEVAKELKISDAQKDRLPDAVMKALKDVLEPAQYKRLEQIQLQQRGAFALNDADIQAKLNLSASQKDDLKTLFADYEKEVNELRGAGGKGGKGGKGGFGKGGFGNFQKIATLRKEVGEKALSVLNDSQRETWRELTGPTFELQGFGGGRFGGKDGKGGKGGKGGFGKKKKSDTE